MIGLDSVFALFLECWQLVIVDILTFAVIGWIWLSSCFWLDRIQSSSASRDYVRSSTFRNLVPASLLALLSGFVALLGGEFLC